MLQAECQDLCLQFFIQLACLQHLHKEEGGTSVPEQLDHRVLGSADGNSSLAWCVFGTVSPKGHYFHRKQLFLLEINEK